MTSELDGTQRTSHGGSETVPRPAATKLLLAPDVAKRLGMSTQRIYELVRQKRLPHVRVGRQIRFSSAALQKWIDDGGAA